MFYNAIYPQDIAHYRIGRVSIRSNQLFVFMAHIHNSMPIIRVSCPTRHLSLPKDLFVCTEIGTLSARYYVTTGAKTEIEQEIFDIMNDLFILGDDINWNQ